MHPRWNDITSQERGRRRRTGERGGVHAMAMARQLTWAQDFARAGDLASSLDALGDAKALAQELGHRAGIDSL